MYEIIKITFNVTTVWETVSNYKDAIKLVEELEEDYPESTFWIKKLDNYRILY